MHRAPTHTHTHTHTHTQKTKKIILSYLFVGGNCYVVKHGNQARICQRSGRAISLWDAVVGQGRGGGRERNTFKRNYVISKKIVDFQNTPLALCGYGRLKT